MNRKTLFLVFKIGNIAPILFALFVSEIDLFRRPEKKFVYSVGTFIQLYMNAQFFVHYRHNFSLVIIDADRPKGPSTNNFPFF